MSRQLKGHHRLSIDRLVRKRRFQELDGELTRLAGKGFDVAGVPFRLLDGALAEDDSDAIAGLGAVAHHTLGGQPQLLQAALFDLKVGAAALLHDLVKDDATHPMTRFEAMGWAGFVTHGGSLGLEGRPADGIFQFWDAKTPPPEIEAGCEQWAAASNGYHRYSEAEAQAYIATHFGADAAAEFEGLWHPALKSDLFRLYRLAQEGGVYCDADSTPQLQIGRFLATAGERVWMSSMTNVPNCVVINGFIAAPAKSPFIEELLVEVQRNLAEPGGRGIFWLSGPGAYTDFLYRNLARYDVGLLPNLTLKTHYFRQFDAPYKHTTQNWRVYEHALGMDNEAGLAQVLRPV